MKLNVAVPRLWLNLRVRQCSWVVFFRIFFTLTLAIYSQILPGAPAIGQFEVKHLEVESGKWEFQSQNAFSFGNPSRKTFLQNGNTVNDDNNIVKQRHALEIERGFGTRFRCRLGIEFEKTLSGGGDSSSQSLSNYADGLEFEETAIEIVYVLVPPKGRAMGIGLLVEGQKAVDDDEGDSVVFHLLLQGKRGIYRYLLNTGFIKHYGIEDKKTDFSYAAQGIRGFGNELEIGWEIYGTLDRISSGQKEVLGRSIFGDYHQHRAGPVVYSRVRLPFVGSEELLKIGFGFFMGLNSNTPDQTLKSSIEYDF